MSHLLAASIGSYPRTGEDKDQQRYPRALGHFERKEISAHALRDVEQSVAQEIIREQLDAGVDEPTDGLIAWPDPISRFTRHLSNVKHGGLSRYFDNNFYYRMPIIGGKPKIGPAVSTAEFHFAKSISNKPVRAVLTGPVTLALHTGASAKPYDRLQARVDLFTDVIVQEVAALAGEGATVIQIDEPSLVSFPAHAPLLAPAAARFAAAKGHARLAIALYFGSPAPLIDALKSLPFDIWQLEALVDLSGLLERLSSAPSHVTLGLGILDGRSTRMEPADGVAGQLNAWLAGRKNATHYVTPSCGLEYLPRPAASAKLRRLVEIRRNLGGVVLEVPGA
jgi:5-methyltetrahydropteroyltriglutamate--homocysteine methyltransferase